MPFYFHYSKENDAKKECENHRGINQHEIVGKVFAKFLLNQQTMWTYPSISPENQCGLRPTPVTMEMSFLFWSSTQG